MKLDELKKDIIKYGGVKKMSKNIGTHPSTLHRKLKPGGTPFKVIEADIMIKELKLSKEKVKRYFFNQ